MTNRQRNWAIAIGVSLLGILVILMILKAEKDAKSSTASNDKLRGMVSGAVGEIDPEAEKIVGVLPRFG